MRSSSWSYSYLFRDPFGISTITSTSTGAPSPPADRHPATRLWPRFAAASIRGHLRGPRRLLSRRARWPADPRGRPQRPVGMVRRRPRGRQRPVPGRVLRLDHRSGPADPVDQRERLTVVVGGVLL